MRPLNLCRECGRDFSSLRAFDAHRTGSHSRNTRRCRENMSGFVKDPRGRFTLVARRNDARRRYTDDPDIAQAA